MSLDPKIPIHPVQTHSIHDGGCVPQKVTLAAYEVYKHVYGAQEAMITGGCRGGFGVGELIAFLYARSFPREEWRCRVDEAFRGMELDGKYVDTAILRWERYTGRQVRHAATGLTFEQMTTLRKSSAPPVQSPSSNGEVSGERSVHSETKGEE